MNGNGKKSISFYVSAGILLLLLILLSYLLEQYYSPLGWVLCFGVLGLVFMIRQIPLKHRARKNGTVISESGGKLRPPENPAAPRGLSPSAGDLLRARDGLENAAANRPAEGHQDRG